MIPAHDIPSLRASFTQWRNPGLPPTLPAEWAAALGISDITISLVGGSGHIVLASSSVDARTVNEWEFTFQEGPGMDAARIGESVSATLSPSLIGRWPRLAAKAGAAGYRSIGAIPWRADGSVFATVHLFDRQQPISPAILDAADRIAGHLTVVVLESLGRSTSLGRDSRQDAFHQATGMVMAQMSIDVVAAAAQLRAHAWSHDRQVVEVAADVVARTLAFPVRPTAGAPRRVSSRPG